MGPVRPHWSIASPASSDQRAAACCSTAKTPRAGSPTISGVRVWRGRFQAGRLFKDMTVLENVEVTATGLGFSRRVAADMAAKILSWIELDDKAHLLASALAYTDQRRVSIACALVE